MLRLPRPLRPVDRTNEAPFAPGAQVARLAPGGAESHVSGQSLWFRARFLFDISNAGHTGARDAGVTQRWGGGRWEDGQST